MWKATDWDIYHITRSATVTSKDPLYSDPVSRLHLLKRIHWVRFPYLFARSWVTPFFSHCLPWGIVYTARVDLCLSPFSTTWFVNTQWPYEWRSFAIHYITPYLITGNKILQHTLRRNRRSNTDNLHSGLDSEPYARTDLTTALKTRPLTNEEMSSDATDVWIYRRLMGPSVHTTTLLPMSNHLVRFT